MIYKTAATLCDWTDEELEQAISQLPVSEQLYIMEVKHRQGRCEKLTAYRLLQACLSEMGISDPSPIIVRPKKGKPMLQNYSNISFNISHCKQYVGVAINEKGEVGIDVECRRKYSHALVERVCSSDELASIQESNDPQLCFLKLWTRKEAYLKMTGEGIGGFEQLQSVPPHNLLPSIKSISAPLSTNDGIVTVYWEERE